MRVRRVRTGLSTSSEGFHVGIVDPVLYEVALQHVFGKVRVSARSRIPSYVNQMLYAEGIE